MPPPRYPRGDPQQGHPPSRPRPLPVPRPPLHPFPMQPPRPQPAAPPGGRPLSSKLHSGCRAVLPHPAGIQPPAGSEQPVFAHRDGFSRKPQKAKGDPTRIPLCEGADIPGARRLLLPPRPWTTTLIPCPLLFLYIWGRALSHRSHIRVFHSIDRTRWYCRGSYRRSPGTVTHHFLPLPIPDRFPRKAGSCSLA